MLASWQVFGRKAHLVLEDEDGLFEVRNPILQTTDGTLRLDSARIADAIGDRNGERSNRNTQKWPVY